MAPAAGFEPATKWLTATYSTAELCRNIQHLLMISLNIHPVWTISSRICRNFLISLHKNEKIVLLLRGKAYPNSSGK